MIYSINDKANNLFRSIPNTKFFTNFRIVFCQEILIKMYKRILSIVVKDTLHFCDFKYLYQLFNNPFNATMKFC